MWTMLIAGLIPSATLIATKAKRTDSQLWYSLPSDVPCLSAALLQSGGLLRVTSRSFVCPMSVPLLNMFMQHCASVPFNWCVWPSVAMLAILQLEYCCLSLYVLSRRASVYLGHHRLTPSFITCCVYRLLLFNYDCNFCSANCLSTVSGLCFATSVSWDAVEQFILNYSAEKMSKRKNYENSQLFCRMC